MNLCKLLDKGGLKKISNADFSKVLMPKKWQNFPQIDGFSVDKVALYGSPKYLNGSDDALVPIFKVDKLSLKNISEKDRPIPTKTALEVNNFTFPKRVIDQLAIPQFKHLSLNVNLYFQAAWSREERVFKTDNSFIESTHIGRLAFGAEFFSVNDRLFWGEPFELRANLPKVIVDKLVLRYEYRGLKDQSFSFVAGLGGNSLNELKAKAID